MPKSGYKPVIDYTRHILERTEHFTGRLWVFQAVTEWLSDTASGRFFILTGNPGSGKTAMAARLSQVSDGASVNLQSLLPHRDFLDAKHFCSARDRRWINPHVFAESVAIQLAKRYPAFAEALATKRSERNIVMTVKQDVRVGEHIIGILIEHLDVSGLSAEDAFGHVVREPLEMVWRDGEMKQVVILVDALDEASLYTGQIGILHLIGQAQALPEGVRFIVTSRDQPDVLRELRRNPGVERSLTSGDGLKQSDEDIRKFVLVNAQSHRLSARLSNELTVEEFAHSVTEKAGGNFLYVGYLLKMLEGDAQIITRQALERLPTGLDGIYAEFFERLLNGHQDRWHTELAPILGTLAVSQEPITEIQLASFLGLTRSNVRELLGRVWQILDKDETMPATERRYALYHRSVADFLLEPNRAGIYWCEEELQHRRVAQAYHQRSRWSEVDWHKADEYGLRHVVHHILHGGEDGLAAASEIVTQEFAQAKNKRFGHDRGLLEDLGQIIAAAHSASDLARLFGAIWAEKCWRGRIAHALVPETLPLRVRLGQADLAIQMIDSLDSTSETLIDEADKVREHMACALVEQGRLEDALNIARSVRPDQVPFVLGQVAERLASYDPAAALKILRDGRITSISPEFCRRLAQDPTLVETAVQMANHSGACLEAIALTVALRNVDEALAIIETIESFTEDLAGETRNRDSDVARASLAIQVGTQTPELARRLLAQVRSQNELSRAAIANAAFCATTDGIAAFSFLDYLREPSKHIGSLVTIDDREQPQLEPDYVARSLALARIAAASPDPAVKSESMRRWKGQVSTVPFSSLNDDLDLLARVDLLPCRTDAFATEILVQTLDQLVALIRKYNPEFRYAYQAAGVLAAALAYVDLEKALKFLNWAKVNMKGRDGSLYDEALLKVVKSLARFDSEAVRRVLKLVRGYHQHLAYVEAVRAISLYSYDQALAVVDDVDPRFARSKAILIGVISEQLRPDEKERGQELLAHIPHYSESEAFFLPLSQAADALAGEIARSDVTRAIAFSEQYKNFGRDQHDDTHLAEVAIHAASHAYEQAALVAQKVRAGLPRVRVLVALARNAGNPEASLRLLREAGDLARQQPPGLVQRDQVLVELALEMLKFDYGEAFSLVSDIGQDAVRSRVITSVLKKLRNKGEIPDLEQVVRELWTASKNADSMNAFRDRTLAFINLLSLCDEKEVIVVLDLLDTIDPNLGKRMRGWHVAEVDPSLAVSILNQVLNAEEIWWKEAAARYARRDPEGALQLFEQHNDGNDAYDLAEIFRSIAEADMEQALRLIEARSWNYESHKADSFAAVARVVVRRDWRRAIDIVHRIPNEEGAGNSLKFRMALEALLENLPEELTASERAAAQAALATEVMALQNPDDRKAAYRTLLDELIATPAVDCRLTNDLLYSLSTGDRDTFLRLLPRLIKLVCKGDSEMPQRLEIEFDRVRSLLAA